MAKLTIDERLLITKKALELGSDGCSKVLDTSIICCYEHDIPYRTGRNYKGEEVTKADTDKRFRECIQEESTNKVRGFIASWTRWFGVSVLNRNGGFWNKK